MADVEQLDPADREQMRDFHACSVSAGRHGRSWPVDFSLDELTTFLRRPTNDEAHECYFVRVDDGPEETGGVIGVGGIDLPLLDNLNDAHIGVGVHPQHRRRGVGATLMRHLLVRAREHGRGSVSSFIAGVATDETGRPVAAGPTAGESFAARFGLTHRNADVHRVLRSPVAADLLDRLTEQAAPHHRGYRFAHWRDRCPDEHVSAYCGLLTAMNTQAPSGTFEIEESVWTPARLREHESQRLAMDRDTCTVIAVQADGDIAGHTMLVRPRSDPPNAFQWDTLVLPAHRGHRLGLGLKVANHRRFQESFPEPRTIHTWNAASNAPMVAVNQALGYTPVELVGEWQGPVPA